MRSAAVFTVTAVLALTAAAGAVMSSYYHHQMGKMMEALNEKNAAILQLVQQADSVPVPEMPSRGMAPGQIYLQNADAVVTVMNDMGTDPQGIPMGGSGSGFLISEDGYVVTNCHVVEGAAKVSIVDNSGVPYDARIIGKDDISDIALLKVDAGGFHGLEFGSSSAVSVGEPVVAIGHPLGKQSAVLTVGYVSAKDQVVTTASSSFNMLQTDAAINSGSSGGPLFNAQGQVVGITTAKYSGYSASGAVVEGTGYAIPIDDVRDMLEDLREFGRVKSAYLGAYVKNMDPVVKQYGFPDGVYIQEPMEGMAAKKAGFLPKDVLVSLGGYNVASLPELQRVLHKFEGGDTVTAEVWRGGQYVYLTVTLDEKPETVPEPSEQP